MKKFRLLFSVLVTVFILNSADSFCQDWPQWRGMNRDSKVTGFKAPAAWPSELKQVWKVTCRFW